MAGRRRRLSAVPDAVTEEEASAAPVADAFEDDLLPGGPQATDTADGGPAILADEEDGCPYPGCTREADHPGDHDVPGVDDGQDRRDETFPDLPDEERVTPRNVGELVEIPDAELTSVAFSPHSNGATFDVVWEVSIAHAATVATIQDGLDVYWAGQMLGTGGEWKGGSFAKDPDLGRHLTVKIRLPQSSLVKGASALSKLVDKGVRSGTLGLRPQQLTIDGLVDEAGQPKLVDLTSRAE